MKKQVSKWIYLFFVAGLMMTVLTGCGASKTVDCQQLIKVSFRGPESYATPVFSFNKDVASDREAMKKMFPDKTREEAQGILEELFETLVITADRQENLKNGDALAVTVDVKGAGSLLKEYGLKLSNTGFQVTVADLKEAVVLNPFQNILVTFDGADGDGYVIIDVSGVEHVDVLHQYGTYSAEYDPLSNGDVVTVQFTFTGNGEKKLLEAGYVLSAQEEEFIVSGLEAAK